MKIEYAIEDDSNKVRVGDMNSGDCFLTLNSEYCIITKHPALHDYEVSVGAMSYVWGFDLKNNQLSFFLPELYKTPIKAKVVILDESQA